METSNKIAVHNKILHGKDTINKATKALMMFKNVAWKKKSKFNLFNGEGSCYHSELIAVKPIIRLESPFSYNGLLLD